MSDCEVCGDNDVDGHEHEAVIVREGASLRTADELAVCLLEDTAHLTEDAKIVSLASEWAAVLADARDPHTGIAWLPEDDETFTREGLDDDAFAAEAVLDAKGYLVVHDDGYVIYRARPQGARVAGG